MTVFLVQELILSGLYVWKAWEFLHNYRQRQGQRGEREMRVMMIHLILSNVIVVVRTYSPLFLFMCV